MSTRALICVLVMLSSGCSAKDPELSTQQSAARSKKNDGLLDKNLALIIQLQKDEISLPLGTVRIRDSLAKWKKAIPGSPRCTNPRTPPMLCIWDKLGIQIATDDSVEKVNSFRLYLNPPPEDYLEPLPNNPDGTPQSTSPLPPSSVYSGQLQFDGINVTANTPYSAVGPRLASERNVRCGLRDCSSPHGMFGERTKLFFHLTGRRDENLIERFSIQWVDYGTADLTK